MRALFTACRRIADSRDPDFIIGPPSDPYLLRWWVIPRNRWFNIYLHKMLKDDDDRALHDHPWVNVSIILDGGYWEKMPHDTKRRRPGDIVWRWPSAAHRLFLEIGSLTGNRRVSWSLFITGPRVREWGFHCPRGWRRWQDFTSPLNKGEVGQGCE